ncbi:MAG: hypothetical protein AVDCRST_MAG80-2615 [uncultured Rubrobacteraceae bacterium]|uniref:Uncharacterized protein n=1 Tax=uncultured Rubrobacteraceae bacterium TaxID=349277 RepID=A0A6J4R0Z2_9ACTN|nr:MAG: hypothetical protein AVDCRST_MAG80-2615 [uncultured Rubrobacteraceae bacterium]
MRRVRRGGLLSLDRSCQYVLAGYSEATLIAASRRYERPAPL